MASISIEFDGRTVSGSYTTSKGMITVTMSGGGTKATQLGGSAAHPEGLAKMMLRELAQEQRR